MNIFHAYVWLAGQSNKASDEKSGDPPNLLAPFPEVNAAINTMNLFHAFVWMNKAMNF